jgi:methylmalonate-semialdehyde dehydrogenase [acylating] (EC 1.2.1.27)
MSIHWTSAPARVSHWIDNEIHQGSGAGSSPVFDPAHGRVVRSVDLATEAEVDAAVASAVRAQPSWAEHAPQRRARVLFRMKALVEQHADELAA